MQAILHALSDPVRVEIFTQLMNAECTQNCTAFLNVGPTPLPKSTLSHHFKILREAGLVHSERRGVELQNRTRCVEFKPKFGGLVGEILEAYKRERKGQTPAPKAAKKRRA